MKRKHRVEKWLSSIFGTHIDPENQGVFEDKKEVEKNVEKILRLLGEEENDTDSGGKSSDKSELASLVNEIYKNYQALHGHYDHVIGNLKKTVHHKDGSNGNFSFHFSSSDSESSDSGSEDFSIKKEKSNKTQEGRAEPKISLKDYQSLQDQLETLKIRNNELEMNAAIMLPKLEENETLAAKLTEKEGTIITLENKLQSMSRNVEDLQAENGVLKEELEASLNQKTDINQQIRSVCEKNEALISENSTTLSRLHEAEESLEESKIEIQQKKDMISELGFENSSLKQELSKTTEELTNLNHQLVALNEEKETLRSESLILLKAKQEIQKDNINLKSAIEDLSSENESLKGKLEAADQQGADLLHKMAAAEKTIEDLDQQLKAKEEKISALASEQLDALEKVQKAGETIEMLSTEIDKLNNKNSELLVNYEGLKLELEAANQVTSELRQTLEANKDEKHLLMSENLALLSKMQQVEKTLDDFKAEREKLEVDNSQLQNNINDLGLELEAANIQLTDLNRVLGAKEEENRSFTLEISMLRSKLQQAEISMKDRESDLEQTQSKIQQAERFLEELKDEKEQLKDDNSRLLGRLTDLGLELEAANLKLADQKEVLGTTVEEKNTLISEVSAAMSKLQQAEINIKQLENDCRHLKEENSLLQENQIRLEQAEKMIDDFKAEKEQFVADNSQLNVKVSGLTIELEAVNLRLIDLKKLLTASEQEKDTLTSEIATVTTKSQQMEANAKKLETDIEELREENSTLQRHESDLKNQNSELQRRLEEAGAEMLGLREELEASKEAFGHIQMVMVHAIDLQVELELLQDQKSELEEQVKSITERSSESQISMKIMEDKLTTRISILEAGLKEQKDNFDELLVNFKQIEHQFQESCAKLEMAERKIKEIEEETIHKLEMVDKKQKGEISKLEESHNDLVRKLQVFEVEKGDVDREIAKLNGQVQTLEVQLRLSNQKLKITETESREKEENFKKMAEALWEEHSKLGEQLKSSSGKIIFLENELKNMKVVAENGVIALEDKFQKLEVVLEQDCGNVRNRLVGCTEELKIVKTQLAEQLSEKQELEFEKHELSVRLNNNDRIILMLKDKAGALGASLAEKEKDKETLMRRVSETEKKMEELERRLRDREDELMVKDEEKRDAIRQLCLLIEYHRENCNHLYRYLSATVKRSRR